MSKSFTFPISGDEIPEYMAAQGLTYLKRPLEDYPDADTLDWTGSPYFRDHIETFGKINHRYRVGLETGTLAAVEIRDLGPGVGLGLFAAQDIKRLGWVGEYTGRVSLAQDIEDLTMIDGHYHSDYAWTFPDELPDGTLLEINALKEGNELRYVNHSFKPNLSPDHTLWQGRWVTFFRAKRPIKAGEQLTVDYGVEYWDTDNRTLVVFPEEMNKK